MTRTILIVATLILLPILALGCEGVATYGTSPDTAWYYGAPGDGAYYGYYGYPYYWDYPYGGVGIGVYDFDRGHRGEFHEGHGGHGGGRGWHH